MGQTIKRSGFFNNRSCRRRTTQGLLRRLGVSEFIKFNCKRTVALCASSWAFFLWSAAVYYLKEKNGQRLMNAKNWWLFTSFCLVALFFRLYYQLPLQMPAFSRLLAGCRLFRCYWARLCWRSDDATGCHWSITGRMSSWMLSEWSFCWTLLE